MKDARPNIVLVNCDDLGFGDLGCYGSTLHDTPAIDALAAEGIRFTSFYMASPVCSPSRGALLTGCYPPRIGFGQFEGLPVLFPGQPVGLPSSEVSIARVLSDAGYRTMMIGKWHCGDQAGFLPLNHGFDQYFGLPYSNDMGRQVNRQDWMPDYPPLPLMRDHDVLEQQPDQSLLTERYVHEAIRFVRQPDDRPFFLYLAHMYVHLPLYVKDEFLRASRNGRYGAAVETLDWATGAVMAELDARGLDDDTIVVFTSDNGSLGNVPAPVGGDGESIGGSNYPLRGSKASTWEGGLRVPAIVRWRGRIPAGRVCDELLLSLDLYPTLAGCAGASLPSDRVIDGKDVAEVWMDPDRRSPHESFAYYLGNNLEAVRDRRWKLHFAKRKREISELYDLATDPSETTNVYDRHPDEVSRLTRMAEDYRCALGDARLGRVGTEVRPIGRVEDPVTLTRFDPDHPYFAAEYDLDDRG